MDIDYTGISNLGSFAITYDGAGTVTLTDSNGGSVAYPIASMENLTVNSIAYSKVGGGNAYWNSTEKVVYANQPISLSSSDITGLSGLSASDNLSIQGSPSTDTLNLNIDRSSALTGNLTVALKEGTDTLNSAKLKDGDSIDMGAGNDAVYLMLTGSDGTPAIGAANISNLDGGAGVDTLGFEESGSNTGTLTLTTAGATNFENLVGTAGAETLTGDNNDNVLEGKGGADTLNGNGGNDTLCPESCSGGGSTNDNLYGGAGNDTLLGNDGDNILDGGTGADSITTGSGSDTIVIRSGDGGASIADADTLTDFTDGADIIGMSGLEYSQLTIEQGTGDYANHVVVKKTDTGEFLLIIQSTSLSSISNADFSAI